METVSGRSSEETSTAVIGGLHVNFRQIVKDTATAFNVDLNKKTFRRLSPQSVAAGRSTPYRYPEVLLRIAVGRPQTLACLAERHSSDSRTMLSVFLTPSETRLRSILTAIQACSQDQKG
jgi:hypothetical protein